MPPTVLVNRGAAGLLKKLPPNQKTEDRVEVPAKPIISNNISLLLRQAGFVVPISSLLPDPNNAKLHPEKNLDAIKASLNDYGQVRPISVQKVSDDGQRHNIIVAGNGTTECAKALGWTEIAAVIHDWNDAQAAGYGIADNRTGELGKWNFKVFARLDKLVSGAGLSMPGWTRDELEVLRAASWRKPEISDEKFSHEKKKEDSAAFSFDKNQYGVVSAAVNTFRVLENASLTQEECVELICMSWLEEQERLLAELMSPAEQVEEVSATPPLATIQEECQEVSVIGYFSPPEEIFDQISQPE